MARLGNAGGLERTPNRSTVPPWNRCYYQEYARCLDHDIGGVFALGLSNLMHAAP